MAKVRIYVVPITICWWENVNMCRFIIAWGVVGWICTSAVIATFVLGALNIWGLPLLAEMGIWIGGSVYWSIAAIASAAADRTFEESITAGYVVIVLLWLLIALSITSSILCCSARCCGRRGQAVIHKEADTEAGSTAADHTQPSAAKEQPTKAETVPTPHTGETAAS
ncbi:hypothetical protein MMPV_008669 [Pyropia vietnamensis]